LLLHSKLEVRNIRSLNDAYFTEMARLCEALSADLQILRMLFFPTRNG
jgi:hypothetical protein